MPEFFGRDSGYYYGEDMNKAYTLRWVHENNLMYVVSINNKRIGKFNSIVFNKITRVYLVDEDGYNKYYYDQDSFFRALRYILDN